MSNTRATFTALAAATAALLGAPGAASAEQIIGLTTGNALVLFDSATPGTATAPVGISGLAAGESILGIDLRPATGAIYGLGSAGNLYTLNASTGSATFVSLLKADPADLTSPYTALSGSAFGVDFNPVADRLRIVSTTGQNLRVNVANGNTTTDGNLNGATTNAVAAAYTNNDNDAATTTTALFDISGLTDTLYTQAPPNDGTLVAVGSGLGVNTSDVAGFDISGTTGAAFASLTDANGASRLYSINLATGTATLIGATATSLRDITVAAPIPEPETYALMLAGLAAVGFAARRRSRG